MDTVLGVDLGTSSLKVLAVSPKGQVLASARRGYPIQTPRPGWAEQQPEDWWRAFVEAAREVVAALGDRPGAIRTIGLSGQMHGTVLVDDDDRPVRPAIIWADRRSAPQVRTLTDAVGAERLQRITRNPPCVGFQAPTVLWLRQHEPEVFDRTARILLPKDHLRQQLTGVVLSEPTDASGTLFFDLGEGRWSTEILDRLGLDAGLLPSLCGTGDVAGRLTSRAARETGLTPGIPVVAGGSDQAMGALGAGLFRPGPVGVTIATGGQVVACVGEPAGDPAGRLHTFAHALEGRWLLIAATLSAGLCLKWYRDMILDASARVDEDGLFDAVCAGATAIAPGADGLLFLPYLAGERTPHLDPDARAAFIGLDAAHTRWHLARALMEGVVFSLRDGLEVLLEQGLTPERAVLSGGGARGGLWHQLVADILDLEVATTEVEGDAPYGAALLAGVAAGFWSNAEQACEAAVRTVPRASPDPRHRQRYEALYPIYRAVYGRLKPTFDALVLWRATHD